MVIRTQNDLDFHFPIRKQCDRLKLRFLRKRTRFPAKMQVGSWLNLR